MTTTSVYAGTMGMMTLSKNPVKNGIKKKEKIQR